MAMLMSNASLFLLFIICSSPRQDKNCPFQNIHKIISPDINLAFPGHSELLEII